MNFLLESCTKDGKSAQGVTLSESLDQISTPLYDSKYKIIRLFILFSLELI